MSGLIFAALLFLANLARVAILVTVGQALNLRLLAEMLHVPLGVLGFAGACAALVWMLRRFVPEMDVAEPAARHPLEAAGPRWLAPTLGIAILGLALLYTPRQQAAAAQSGSPLRFQDGLAVEPWEFTSGELAWLSTDGPLAASRWRFEWEDYSGSLLLITSNTWRAHHRPERCFEAYGLTIDQSHSQLLNADFPLRLVSLRAAQKRQGYTAVYWLQAPGRVTDDYATRIWSDLSSQRQTWVLVTILFDRQVDPLEVGLEGLYNGLRQSVDDSLRGRQ
jgi:exosortase O